VPTAVIAAMHTTEISAAIKPYSIEVTPESSLTKREKRERRVRIERILYWFASKFEMAPFEDAIVTANILKSATEAIRLDGLAPCTKIVRTD
jgi:hypothetical protein